MIHQMCLFAVYRFARSASDRMLYTAVTSSFELKNAAAAGRSSAVSAFADGDADIVEGC